MLIADGFFVLDLYNEALRLTLGGRCDCHCQENHQETNSCCFRLHCFPSSICRIRVSVATAHRSWTLRSFPGCVLGTGLLSHSICHAYYKALSTAAALGADAAPLRETWLGVTQSKKKSGIACDGAADWAQAALPSATTHRQPAGPATRPRSTSNSIFISALWTVSWRFKPGLFTAYCIPYRKFTLSVQLPTT